MEELERAPSHLLYLAMETRSWDMKPSQMETVLHKGNSYGTSSG